MAKVTMENLTPQQLTKEYYSLFHKSAQYKQYFISYLLYCELDIEEEYTLAEALDAKMYNITQRMIDELIEKYIDEDWCEGDYEAFAEVLTEKLYEGFGVIDVVGLCCEVRGSCFDKFAPIRKVLEKV